MLCVFSKQRCWCRDMEKQHKAAGAAELQDRESQHCETHPLEKGHFALSIENRNMLVYMLDNKGSHFLHSYLKSDTCIGHLSRHYSLGKTVANFIAVL